MTPPSARPATSAKPKPHKPRRGKTPAARRAFGRWYCQPHQDALWRYLASGGLRAAAVWHRRAGKDDLALRWAFQAMCTRKGNYWHMLPQAEQARKAIWDAINPHTGVRRIDEAFPLEARKRTRNNEMMIELHTGSIWQVVGSDNYNALVGSPPIGVVFSEWSLADPASWAYISPILRENGGWALFLYTPRGRNHGLSTYQLARSSPNWFAEVLPATLTDVFTAQELAEELKERQADFGPDLGQSYFDQEYLCSFDAAVVGAIYASWIRKAEREDRIGLYPAVKGYPVHTAWDLGYSDATGVWYWQQLPGPEIRLVEYMQFSNKPPEHYAAQLYGRTIEVDAYGAYVLGDEIEGLEHRRAYQYGKHYVPHDAANKTLAAGGRSFGDQMFKLGFNLDVISAVNQLDGIQAARATLPFCTWNRPRTQDGIDALESYHFPWDSKTKRLKDEPAHDWSSHGCDALEIIGQVWQPPSRIQKPKKARFLNDATADEIFWGEDSKSAKQLERL